MQKKVHVKKAKENPIVSRVLKNVQKRHRIIAKSVD